jgi:AraC family L-rhamnose operon transcriptional activator RhaR
MRRQAKVGRIRSGSIFPIPDFTLVVLRADRHGETSAHGHEFMELVVITGGSGTHFTEDEQYPISRGDVFVIARNRSHGYRDVHDLGLVNILFDPVRLALPLHDLAKVPGYHVLFTLEPAWRRKHRFESRLRLGPRELSHVEGLIHNLMAEQEAREPGHRLLTLSWLMQIIGYLSRCYGRRSLEGRAAALLRIGQAISHLEANYAEPVRLATLAEIAHMSVRTLLREFGQAMETSPIDYLVRLRVSRAAELLLKAPELNVTEIAFRTGFSDSNYFSRMFRRAMGVSPREYRQGKVAVSRS